MTVALVDKKLKIRFNTGYRWENILCKYIIRAEYKNEGKTSKVGIKLQIINDSFKPTLKIDNLVVSNNQRNDLNFAIIGRYVWPKS